MIVHLLVDQTGGEAPKEKKPHHAYAKCGAVVAHRAGSPLPTMSAFASRVTCDDCKEPR